MVTRPLHPSPPLVPVDVIICHHHGRDRLAACLAALYGGTHVPQRVVVVDNASRDGSAELLHEQYPQVQVLQSAVNLGFVRGNMLAYRTLQDAPNPYLWLLNNDTVVSADCLHALYQTLEHAPSIAAVQPKMISIPYAGRFDYAGGAGGYLDRYGFPFARGRLLTTLEADEGQYDTPAYILWASGASFFVRHAVTQEVDLFDESYYAVSEEIDLSWRIWLRGYHVVAQPRAVVWHHGGFTPDSMHAQGMYYRHRNSIMTLLKNASRRQLRRVLPMRILLELLAILYALSQGDARYAYAVMRSAAWLVRHMRMIMRQRHYVQTTLRTVSDEALQHLFYPRSIALTYYLGRVRHFSALDWRGAHARQVAINAIDTAQTLPDR